jgi:hypothetical protein
LGGELDFLSGLLVRGVCGGDDQTVAALAEHQHAIGLADLGVQQILGQALGVDGVEIEQGGAKDSRDSVRKIGGRYCAGARQLCDKAAATGLRLPEDVFCGFGGELAGRNQCPAQAGQGN